MKLRDIPKDELELMSYDDIALIVLQESGKKMTLKDIFKKICEALELPDSVYEEELIAFFEKMSINKKFVMLENGYWDLQSRHNLNMVVEDMEEDEEIVDDVNDEVIDDIRYDIEDIMDTSIYEDIIDDIF